jgi:hypothetical protein
VTEEPQCADHGHTFIELDVVCTDKGQHRPYRLLQVMIGPKPEDFRPVTDHLSFRPAGRGSPLGGSSGHDEFHCPRCHRNTRINHQRFVHGLQQLVQSGITKLDVSRLPF